jgi:hypothetical protein
MAGFAGVSSEPHASIAAGMAASVLKSAIFEANMRTY